MRKKSQDYRDLEHSRDIDAITQVLDRSEAEQLAAMRLPIPLPERQQRVVRLAQQCLRAVRRISPSMCQ